MSENSQRSENISENSEKRLNHRQSGELIQFPLAFELVHTINSQTTTIPLEVINYHFAGACFRLGDKDLSSVLKTSPKHFSLNYRFGNGPKTELNGFRIAWNTFDENGLFGVSFRSNIENIKHREHRIQTNSKFLPLLTATDPLDVTRTIYFQVQNVSEGGLLLSTSLSNKHLLKGMELGSCVLTIPGSVVPSGLKLRIVHTEHSEKELRFFVGVEILEHSKDYQNAIREYLSIFTSETLPLTGRTKKFFSPKTKIRIVGKNIKSHLSYKILKTPKEYEDVLKLRFCGYGTHGKLGDVDHWSKMGEGLNQEGQIIGAYLSGRLVASMELRFSNSQPLRIYRVFSREKVSPFTSEKECCEINKLVIDPRYQGSDIIVGMLQKAHALLLIRGAIDVVIAATDELASLYERIGFRRVGLNAPHLTVPTLNLNLMVLPSDVYSKAEGINPYAWSVVFSLTQRYLAKNGLVRPIRFTRRQQAVHALTSSYVKLRKRNIKATSNHESKLNEISPKWTTPHIMAEIILPYLMAGDRIAGKEKVNDILGEMGLFRSYFTKHGNWISVSFLDEFLDQFQRFGDLKKISKLSGQLSISAETLGAKYYILKHFLSPEEAFKASEKILPKINRTRTYCVKKAMPGYVEIDVGLVNGAQLPKHSESCLNWIENFSAYVRVMTGSDATIEKQSCCYEGHNACSYAIKWKPNGRRIEKLSSVISFPILAISPFLIFLFPKYVFLVGTVDLFFICLLFLKQIRLNKESRSVDSKIELMESASLERYEQLQQTKNQLDQRYKELSLLEETSLQISKNSELSSTLSATLRQICSNFGFGRAFVMLADEKTENLVTAAIAGIDGDNKDIWNFKVDLTQKRDNPLVVSSVFHHSKPTIIKNVADHFANLNEHSRKLINVFGVTSFVIIPIPSENKNWGILIADRDAKSPPIESSDLDLLTRVSQHLGIALDKQSQLESERKKTALFQKFVPAYAKSDLLNLGQSALGWDLRETIAMFVDIRGYTEKTASLSPPAVAALVNGFYGLAHSKAIQHKGYTDKFIGDAALITWGYIEPLNQSSDSAVRCGLDILSDLKLLNEKFKLEGIPELKIGIGIHRGPAVCGLFGCNERMDFTGIGTTANCASRLQTFCKESKATLAISQTIIDSLSVDHFPNFDYVENVQLRGLPNAIRVGLYRQ